MVQGQRTQNLATKIQAGIHTLLADVSESSGGNDTGPTPHELLEAALAACTIITCQMYAKRKNWNLESTDAQVQILLEGAETTISNKLNFRGDLTAEQRQKILEIADKCPIHRLLESHVIITTEVSDL